MMKIEIDFDMRDKIVLAALKEDYIFVKHNIQNLKALVKKDETPEYIKRDYEYDKKLLKAIKRVLRYYMVHEDYKAFIEENN